MQAAAVLVKWEQLAFCCQKKVMDNGKTKKANYLAVIIRLHGPVRKLYGMFLNNILIFK